nr:helicase [Tanacetum cinerariifolium]
MSAFMDKDTTEGVEPSTIQRLIEMLNQSSSISKAFRMARDWCCAHSPNHVEVKLHGDRTKARQYNKPTMSEVAALITNDFEHCKCKTPNQIDDIISTKLPFQEEDPEGYKVVTEFMLHGPYGKDAKSSPCNLEEKCSKCFLKAFNAETIIAADGYHIYRRRDTKASAVKGKFKYDNRYVVPHNRYLLLKYQEHINVEWCNRLKEIKYLFKYLNKGPDRATIVIQENIRSGDDGTINKVTEVDEIKNFSNYRYLAPCEAVWRLFLFDIHYFNPSVMKLNYH